MTDDVPASAAQASLDLDHGIGAAGEGYFSHLAGDNKAYNVFDFKDLCCRRSCGNLYLQTGKLMEFHRVIMA